MDHRWTVRARLAACCGCLLALALALTPAVAGPASGPGPTVVREPIAFRVTNPVVPGHTYTIRGELVRPRAGCSGSVLLAMHGLSYGQWAWDFPLSPATYSVAQALAERGYATVAVDELGYGTSAGPGAPDHPNGYTITVEGYADMAAQMAMQLRAGSYAAAHPVPFARVGLMGHSAGTEIVELAAALHPGVADVLIPTAYTHEPFVDNNWLAREWTKDNERAATSDYEYFETDRATRAQDMYHLANADPAVVEWDNDHANLTASGEIFSAGPQPSRSLLALIKVPVLVVLAEHDALFPASYGPQEMLWFQGTADKTLLVAPNDGHAFMLHRNAGVTNDRIAAWLERHRTALPPC